MARTHPRLSADLRWPTDDQPCRSLKQFGPVLNFGDLAPRDELFENWSHLNHAGAMTRAQGSRGWRVWPGSYVRFGARFLLA